MLKANKEHIMIRGSSVIKPCHCTHKYQDERYGYGKRVHNVGGKDSKDSPKLRCTVCGDTKQL